MHGKISRRSFLGGAAATAFAIRRGHAAESARRPNIVFILSDQQHWQALGVQDSTYQTPNLDRLAREGVFFDHAFCTTPQCSPSRGSIYTGLLPHRTGVEGNIASVDHHGEKIPPLPEGTPTIAARLRDAGYTTHYLGKWHLGNEEHFGQHFDSHTFDTLSDPEVSDAALAFLEGREKEKPFALFLNYLNPHDIYEYGFFEKPEAAPEPVPDLPKPPSWPVDLRLKPWPQLHFMREDQGESIHGKAWPYWAQYRAVYREKCRLLDLEVGRVLDTLRQQGALKDTAVIFASDHGDMETHHRLVYKGPFMYDQLVRVPLIVRMPDGTGPERGQRREELISLVDLFPTFCELAGADAGEHDGRSLAPWLLGKGALPRRDYIVSAYLNKQLWVSPIRMLRTKYLKYNAYQGHDDEFYDLQNDPHEMVNLAGRADYAPELAEMRATLRRHLEDTGDTGFHEAWPTDRQNRRLSR